MIGPFRFGPDELGPTEGTELDDALEAIDALGLAAEDVPMRTGPAFSDRVMAALADEPSPAPIGFLLPIQRRGFLAGFGASVRQAWASVGAGRPALGRAMALAYVLVVAVAGTSLAGAATFGAAGALGLLGPHQSVQPSPGPTLAPEVTPVPTLPTTPPTTQPTPSESPEVEPSDDHGGGAEPSDDHGGNSGPGGTDDHGGNSGPGGGSDDGSGGSGGSDDGSSGGSGPSATDDHGGSSGESGSGGGSDTSGGSGSGSWGGSLDD